jgi:hypothetical protein
MDTMIGNTFYDWPQRRKVSTAKNDNIDILREKRL